MATSNGPVMSRRAASGKQHTRPIVPALPLPYVRRQASAAAAAAAAPAVGARSSPSDSAAGSKDTVGAVQRQPESTSVQSPTSTESSVTYAKNNSASSSREPTHANFRANGHGPPPVVSSAGKSGTAAVDIRGVQDANVKHDGAQQAVKPVQQFLPAGLSEPVVTIFGAAAKDGPQSQADGHYPVQAPDARLQSAVSPTSYQMPPPFQPASRPLGIVGNGDMARGTRPHPQNGPHPIHQAHPSNGSIHFGTFHESQSSSPAPPLSGGIAPPPGITGPDGRPAYMGHAGNGFPPMMPYGSDVMPIGNFDNYGRPAVGYGHMETHPAYGSNYAPSTPHSFHDSQSSGHPEDNSMYGAFPPASQRNSAALSGDDARAQNPQRMFGPPDNSGQDCVRHGCRLLISLGRLRVGPVSGLR